MFKIEYTQPKNQETQKEVSVFPEGLEFLNQTLLECNEMLGYALAKGMKVPNSISEVLARISMQKKAKGEKITTDEHLMRFEKEASQLTQIHTTLAKLVSPVTPRSIIATGGFSTNSFHSFGTVPLLRHFMILALVCLAVFILTGTSSYVGNSNFATIAGSSGLPLLLNQLFFLAAAGLGASFFALSMANHYVIKRTFDPSFTSAYWVRFTLGLVAGTILANFVKVDISKIASNNLEQATLAMLGGFSAEAVNRILRRLVVSMTTLVQGEGKEVVVAQEETSKARLLEQEGQIQMGIAAKLICLQQGLITGNDTKTLSIELNKIIGELMAVEAPIPNIANKTNSEKSKDNQKK